MPYGRVGRVELEGGDRMRAATERVLWETVLAAAEVRRKQDRGLKAKKKRSNVRSDDNMPVTQEFATYKAVAARSGQEIMVVLNKDSVAAASEAAVGATPAAARAVQATGNVQGQRSTRGPGAHQDEKYKMAVVAPGSDGQETATVAEPVAVVALA